MVPHGVKLHTFKKDDVNFIVGVLGTTSELLRKYSKDKSFKVYRKEDDSPVTNADYEANEIIVDALSARFPDIPIISEELNIHDNEKILMTSKHFWSLDPLDGTWGFINNKEFFTINLAYVYDGDPIYGFLHVPMQHTLYYTDNESHCFKMHDNKSTAIKPFVKSSDEVDVLVSHVKLGERLQEYLSKFKVSSLTPIPAAVKFGILAEGMGDVYPRFGPTYGWDTAAGHSLLRSLGGEVYDLEGSVLKYNVKLLNPDFIAVREKRFYKK